MYEHLQTVHTGTQSEGALHRCFVWQKDFNAYMKPLKGMVVTYALNRESSLPVVSESIALNHSALPALLATSLKIQPRYLKRFNTGLHALTPLQKSSPRTLG